MTKDDKARMDGIERKIQYWILEHNYFENLVEYYTAKRKDAKRNIFDLDCEYTKIQENATTQEVPGLGIDISDIGISYLAKIGYKLKGDGFDYPPDDAIEKEKSKCVSC